MGNVYPRAIELIVQNKVNVDQLVSHHFDLQDTPDAFQLQADEADDLVKSIVYPAGL